MFALLWQTQHGCERIDAKSRLCVGKRHSSGALNAEIREAIAKEVDAGNFLIAAVPHADDDRRRLRGRSCEKLWDLAREVLPVAVHRERVREPAGMKGDHASDERRTLAPIRSVREHFGVV